jgi:predicted phage terminase large subunit-like protein
MNSPIKQTVEEWLNSVDYSGKDNYIPSEFALEFINFIKLVNGEQGEEHKTPVLHYKMLDQIAGKKKDIANMVFRGAAKTTIMGEYLFLYIAVYGKIPGFGEIPLALYVSDSIENGVKNMRKNLEYRWENSGFLKKYIPKTRFTDVRYEFTNIDGKIFVVKGYGAKTGVRGSKEMGQRPYLAVLDDLVSDEDARSDTVIKSIEDTVYKAIDYALHPSRRKTIWSGTPFNKKDPLYKAVESGAWYVNIYPVCEKFPCTKEEFRGAWEDRFDYEFVKSQYDKALAAGKIADFNQELMLRIMSDEDRLIEDNDITWFNRRSILRYVNRCNVYITTDFATSEKNSADYSVLSVWAINNNSDMLLIDCIIRRQTMDVNIDDLFRLVSRYKPLEVGIEITGQQAGFVSWVRQEMIKRNIFFNLSKTGNVEGIRPNKNKLERLMMMIPRVKQHKLWLPEDMKGTPQMNEILDEIRNASKGGLKSKHDDWLDTFSMLGSIDIITPSTDFIDDPNEKEDNFLTKVFGQDGTMLDENEDIVSGGNYFVN